MAKSCLKEEERIAEEFRKFPCLYDEGNEGYKEKDRKNNSWREIFSFKWNTKYSYFIRKCDICKIWWERMRLKTLILQNNNLVNEINLFLWE